MENNGRRTPGEGRRAYWDRWRMDNHGQRRLDVLPKANLHLHLTGSQKPANVRAMAMERFDRMYREGTWDTGPLSPEDKGLLRRLAPHGADVAETTPPSWSSVFQTLYDSAARLITTREDVRRVIMAAARSDAADGTSWLELQVNLTSYAKRLADGDVERTLAIFEYACLEAQVETGIGIRLIVAVRWSDTKEHAERMARVASQFAGQFVVGFGISDDDSKGEPETFTSACAIAHDSGLIVAPHSGFYSGADHVRECVKKLHADRIGHGLRSVEDADVLELLAANNVYLEVCPTSYPPLGLVVQGGVIKSLADLPIATFLEYGVPIVVGSDDPLIFGGGLLRQLEIMRHYMDDAQLAPLAADGITASTAPEIQKSAMLDKLNRWWWDQSRPSAPRLGWTEDPTPPWNLRGAPRQLPRHVAPPATRPPKTPPRREPPDRSLNA